MTDEGQRKTETLFGGRTLPQVLTTNGAAQVKVRQLRVAEYEKAYALLEDEIGLVGFACSVTGDTPAGKDWVLTVAPESYEELHAAVREVNSRGFFVWSQRRSERDQAAQQRLLSMMPPEVLRAASEMAGTSPTPLPLPRPR